MKSKAPLAMMELVVMLLIFSMTAALCLKAFLWSDQVSQDVVLQDEAVLLAQKAAETVKHGRGDFTGADGDGIMESEHCVAYVIPLDSGTRGLGSAAIEVEDRSGTLLYTLPVSWQVSVAGGEAP